MDLKKIYYLYFQQEECLRRILAQPGKVVSIVYQLESGNFLIDDCWEALEGQAGGEGQDGRDVQGQEGADQEAVPNRGDVESGEGEAGGEDLDQLFERARREARNARFRVFWERLESGPYHLFTYL